jgi:hypothetical protein
MGKVPAISSGEEMILIEGMAPNIVLEEYDEVVLTFT